MPDLSCAVTGAGGYLGGVFCSALEARGGKAWRLSRAGDPGGFPPYRLDDPPPPEAFRERGVNALVHAAWDMGRLDEKGSRRLNVDGSLTLFANARAGGVKRLVFVSSLAAHDGARSIYGREKREVEKEVLSMGGVVLRPGTVYGSNPGGLFRNVLARVKAGSLVPVPRHPGPFFLCHQEDVARLVVDAAAGARSAGGGPVFAAHDRGWSLEDLYRVLGRALGRKVRMLPIPLVLLRTGLRFVESLGVSLSLRSDSALSLAHPVSKEELASLPRPPFPFRDFTPEDVLP